MERDFDLILFGATGFTGRRVARLLGERARSLRWAVSGRDRDRTQRVAREAGADAALVVDLADAASLGPIVARTRAVVSTAGPFALYGDALVAACVEHGVHYADITGETAWVRRLIDRHHEPARERGTCIVPCSGFDSVPADLATLRLARHAREELGCELCEVDTVYRIAGGLNGGTLASALEIAEHEDPRALADPWLLVPPDAGTAVRPQRASSQERRHLSDATRPAQIAGDEAWVVPFFMGPINARVVLRSHALAALHPPPDAEGVPRALAGRPGAGYGARFRYREYQQVGSGRWQLEALVATYLLAAGMRALRTRVGRACARNIGPEPGQGPSARALEDGRTRARTVARTSDGHLLELAFDAAGDPGNVVTAEILFQTALILCAPPAALGLGTPGTGGVLTPALAFGEHLLARLGRAPGFRFSGPRSLAPAGLREKTC